MTIQNILLYNSQVFFPLYMLRYDAVPSGLTIYTVAKEISIFHEEIDSQKLTQKKNKKKQSTNSLALVKYRNPPKSVNT